MEKEDEEGKSMERGEGIGERGREEREGREEVEKEE